MRNEMPPTVDGGPFPSSRLPDTNNIVSPTGDRGEATAPHPTNPQDGTHPDITPYPYRMTSAGIEPVLNSSPSPGPPATSSRRKSPKKLETSQYASITDIDVRLHELEQQELNRHETRQEALKRRQVKDAELKRKRDLEDEKWAQEEEVHEKEEGDLRRARKRLKRESLDLASAELTSHPVTSLLQPRARSYNRGSSPPLTSYISANQTIMRRAVPPRRKYHKSEKWDARHGPPQGCDKYGRFVWHREADGRMVTIKCCIMGCFRGERSFKTIHGMMCHLKREHEVKPEGREDLLGMCGDLADMGGQGAGLGDAVPGWDGGENGEEERYTDRGSTEEPSEDVLPYQTGVGGSSGHGVNGSFSMDATSTQVNGTGTADGEHQSSIQPQFQINPSVPVISIESTEEPQVEPLNRPLIQPLIPTNPTEPTNDLDHVMRDAETLFDANVRLPTDTTTSVKEESVSVNQQSRLSSLFEEGIEGESGEREDGGLAEEAEDNMDIAEIVRRNTPDDEIIRRLLSGAAEGAEVVRDGPPTTEVARRDTPDDEALRRLLGGVPESAFAML